MPPKKKAAAEEEVPNELKMARFGRVKNNLKMGLVGTHVCVSLCGSVWVDVFVSAWCVSAV